MTQLLPWRSPLEAVFAKSPFEDWLRDFFENGGRAVPSLLSETRFPKTDIAETENDYLISLELPGMEEKDIEVKLTGDHLLVSGERKQEKKQEGKHFHRLECSYGAFQRTFELPTAVRKDPESISASFKNGMLEIKVPKVEPQPVAKIPVKSPK